MQNVQNAKNINHLWAAVIVEKLIRSGIDQFCISPGSRSTPLTVAAAEHKKAQNRIFFDERAAAFFALGYARATGKAAVLICTSGTAPANYYPAIIEAYTERLPIIVLSADRPSELRNTGANQTINQVHLFAGYTRFFYDLHPPDEGIPLAFLDSILNQAIASVKTINAGPAHINCMFREPLAPALQPVNKSYLADYIPAESGEDVALETDAFPESFIEMESAELILFVGRLEDTKAQDALINFANTFQIPLFADITSGVRLQKRAKTCVRYYDQLLLSETWQQKLSTCTIWHFGEQFVSKRWLLFLQNKKPRHFHISLRDKTIDPVASVLKKIEMDTVSFLNLKCWKGAIGFDKRHLQELLNADEAIEQLLQEELQHKQELSEYGVARIISQHINTHSALFVASSMPIRDMDMYAAVTDKDVLVGANRGASGIDGTIASALGFATGCKRPLVLFIGDLSFLHDLNSLNLLQNVKQPVVIVLINNRGGGIFSFLPIAEYPTVFEKNFATPHPFTFKKSAEQFGLTYYTVQNKKEFITQFTSAQSVNKATLIEVKSERNSNKSAHQTLQSQIKKRI